MATLSVTAVLLCMEAANVIYEQMILVRFIILMLPLIHHWFMIMHMVIKVSCIHSSLNSVDECMWCLWLQTPW